MKRISMQKGGVAVEFAIILPTFLLLLFGIIEFSLILYDQAIITNASREAARSAIAFKTPKLTAQQVQQIAINRSNNLVSFGVGTKTPNVIISPSIIPQTAGASIQVTVQYNYTFLVFGNLLSLVSGGSISNPLTLSATTVMNNE
ncbi:TadE/TadG family type IV pilus assembly protein [Nitrosomonas sp. Nm33]|uniref:TadE/TadG family type IV pilus assembly protein n=1 Tax=Nitrosomonas sp. Nm33 TaxID=133724 RepID=UPI000897879F|nr:TadE/TadG family type IV pilus assembly protein [Nitrosomonas sp. Nm33]SDY03381.1 Flp pilus assembly protein TadG [Nitrosomonas sp. Nm33]